MLRKLILSVMVLAALIGAGFTLACKKDASLALQVRKYHSQYDAGNYVHAYNLATQMVGEGHMNAHYFVGVHHESGNGVEHDMHQALEHYQLAASADYGTAQAHLASLYFIGKGVAKDEKRAAYWFEKAAGNGSPHAQYLLGKMYKNGTGVTQDTSKARTLLQNAAAQGVSEAHIDLAKLASLDLGLR